MFYSAFWGIINLLNSTCIKIAYALTSRGDLHTKLSYAFEVYDTDENGSLTPTEVRAIIHSMLDMLVNEWHLKPGLKQE